MSIKQSLAAKERIKKYPYTGQIGKLTWKGGRTRQSKGYILIKIYPDNPYWGMANKQGYVLEHRLVMAKYLKRVLYSHEDVHHINGDITDNRIENLEVLTHPEHSHRAKNRSSPSSDPNSYIRGWQTRRRNLHTH